MTSQLFNIEDYLNSPEDISAYLDAALEDGDESILLLALREIANKTGGMAQLAENAQLNRESLYKSLSADGNPRLRTLAAILKTFGLRLSVAPLIS